MRIESSVVATYRHIKRPPNCWWAELPRRNVGNYRQLNDRNGKETSSRQVKVSNRK